MYLLLVFLLRRINASAPATPTQWWGLEVGDYVKCGPWVEGKGVRTDMVVEGTFWRGRNPQRKV